MPTTLKMTLLARIATDLLGKKDFGSIVGTR